MKATVPPLRGSNPSLRRARGPHVPERAFRKTLRPIGFCLRAPRLDFEPLATLYGGLQ
jgi:hypothetical protein